MKPIVSNSDFKNPFSVDRVEDWRVEEHSENHIKIASLFSPPDFMNKLEDSEITKGIFIIGGRGCGKSHILRRMAIQAEIKFLESKNNQTTLQLKNFQKKYFGIYLKTDCFSPLSKESISYLTTDQLCILFEHLFNIEVTKAVIEGVKFLIIRFSDLSVDEKVVCRKLNDYLISRNWVSLSVTSFTDILNRLDEQEKRIIDLVKYFPFDNDFSKHSESLHFTKTPDFILDIYNIFRNEIRLLNDKSLVLLLDEFESLDENQQMLINQIIKSRKLTLRIAVKVRGIKTLKTKTSECIEEVHDYIPISLHFKLDKNNRPKYKTLLKNIFENRLDLNYEYGQYKEKNPEILLPAPTLSDEGLTEKEIELELIEFQKSLKKSKENKNPEEYWKNFKGHFKEASIFRVLKKKGKDKLYAGFNEYVSLSSGVVRLFIWLCREAFNEAFKEKVDILNGEAINVSIQNRAAVNVAKQELNITIPQSVKNINASKLAYFIQDIGQILKARLYYSTQPQANRIEIIDPEKFELKEYKIPRELIESGFDLPVLLTETSYTPRDGKYPFPKTFVLNGIFAPLLKIPPEERWRTELRADEIMALCLSESRSDTLGKIVNQIKGKNRAVRKKTDSQVDEKNKEMIDLFGPIPITLANCPITDAGCNRSLHDYYGDTTKAKIHAFLAIPFDDGWVSDPRQWIKDALLEHNIQCKDIDDFPNIGNILCKICLCVRQYPLGIFEITELNPNVIFEFGMATALNRINYVFVYKDKIPEKFKSNFPPQPLNNIEYIPYELSSGSILKKIQEKATSSISVQIKQNDKKCKIINAVCPHGNFTGENKKIFIGAPKDKFFEETYELIKNLVKQYKLKLNKHTPAKSKNELCQICKNVRESSFCIIDTTNNDYSMLFALGVAFGRDKKFIQLHNIELSPARPISDLRSWAIEYKNTNDLKKKLEDELKKRL